MWLLWYAQNQECLPFLATEELVSGDQSMHKEPGDACATAFLLSCARLARLRRVRSGIRAHGLLNGRKGTITDVFGAGPRPPPACEHSAQPCGPGPAEPIPYF